MYLPDGPSETTPWTLDGDEGHHLQRVVRAQAGDVLQVFDGRGREWASSVLATGRGTATCAPASPVVAVAEPPVAVTLLIGVLKGDQMDTVVRDATVMGASTIAPIVTDHVAVPARAWREAAALARWHRVAVAAARQCRRAVVPTILPPCPLREAWNPDAVHTKALVCLEPDAEADLAIDWCDGPRPSHAQLCIGPEGGWSHAEQAWFSERPVTPLRLGPRTLRAEATPMVALATLWSRWGW